MLQPADIATESFAIIRAELIAQGMRLEPPLDVIIKRMIHGTADFEFATLTRASADAVAAGVAALQRGCPILTDVQDGAYWYQRSAGGRLERFAALLC